MRVPYCFLLIAFSLPLFAKDLSVQEVKTTMKLASQFMLDKVSYRGGFVWSYLPDFSRQWGELEAKRSMIWIQPPGTASVGHLFLDAYHATNDEYYYQAAQRVAKAIIFAQQKNGGWNYVADYAGEKSLRDWYNTTGKNAWRLEEFHHYYGNATFDDGGTAESAKFLLRLYLEKKDTQYKKPLDKAIKFVLDSQYPIGGWPQRFPLMYDHPYPDHPDYSSFITFNDDVAEENIDFLLMCYQTLNDQRLREPIIRAMNSFLVTQQGNPQPGWALQYTIELQPAAARSYEPKSLSSTTTANNIMQLIKFYYLTGDRKFLARIPEAISWLESLKFETAEATDGRQFPSFIELGTNRPLFTHRRGSNIKNGQYYVDYTPGKMLAHYKSATHIDIAALKQAYQTATSTNPDEARKLSPLTPGVKFDLPRFFTLGKVSFSDLNFRAQTISTRHSLNEQAIDIMENFHSGGYWLTPLYYTTNPYSVIAKTSNAKNSKSSDEFANTMVGDQWDTSPFPVTQPTMGISTASFIQNMGILIDYLEKAD